MTAMKMQKLAYYSQAWHLAREGTPLFADPIEAWVNGPVVRDLYTTHRGQFSLSSWPRGDIARLTDDQRRLIDEVVETYGERDAQWLSRLTHAEGPWRAARRGLPENARSAAIINTDTMREFYARAQAAGEDPATVTGVRR